MLKSLTKSWYFLINFWADNEVMMMKPSKDLSIFIGQSKDCTRRFVVRFFFLQSNLITIVARPKMRGSILPQIVLIPLNSQVFTRSIRIGWSHPSSFSVGRIEQMPVSMPAKTYGINPYPLGSMYAWYMSLHVVLYKSIICTLPETNPLKIAGWNMTCPFWDALFSGATYIVSGSAGI